MKVLVALFVVAACGAVSASNPFLSKVWHDGAMLVGPPLTEEFVSGEKLRNDIISAFDGYISDLDFNIERQIALEVNEIMQPYGVRYQEIMSKVILAITGPGSVSPDEFDYHLWFLARTYDKVVQIVREGEGQKQRLGLGSEKLDAPEQIAPLIPLSQLFYGYDEVLERDFGNLRQWLVGTFDAGADAVHDAAPLIEENYRQAYMWPMVLTLQRDSRNLAIYDWIIQPHSTPFIWSDYVRARSDLWTL